jgi:WD40 repeat protein
LAQVQRHRRAIAAALLGLVALAFAPAIAQDQGSQDATDLYDRPVLAIDPGMHTSAIEGLAIDRDGRFAVTGGTDGTVRVWSLSDGGLRRTIWAPLGPDSIGSIATVAISPDGSTIAAAGKTESQSNDSPIYLFDFNSGAMIRRIIGDEPDTTRLVTFSPDGRFLTATLSNGGFRAFDRDKSWRQVIHSDQSKDDDDGYGASFAPDGRLATTSFNGHGTIRLYDSKFRLVGGPIKAPSGRLPFRAAFSPDGRTLAVGYEGGVSVVDLFDGHSLARMGSTSFEMGKDHGGLSEVAWSRDGNTLFAAGSAVGNLIFAWDRNGSLRTFQSCAADITRAFGTAPGDRILVSTFSPCLSLMTASGEVIWNVPSPNADFRPLRDTLRVSADGTVVDLGFDETDGGALRFDLRALQLRPQPTTDGRTFPPNREGLNVKDWDGDPSPKLNGDPLDFGDHDMAYSLAIAHDYASFLIGSHFGLTAFDKAGKVRWEASPRSTVWAVNATKDGRLIVTAEGDGTIRWHRADDGRELLALQLLANKKDWVLWTPEGFYEATPNAQDVLKWVVNHGVNRAATTLPASAIPKLHRPDALPLVLQELETARALGIADVAAARLAVQTATGSARPPGGTLHVLAIGVDVFGDLSGGLHLDYAAQDAHDVASALVESQKTAPGKPGLYADVVVQYLPNDRASHITILDALDAMARRMRGGGSNQDLAVILVSSHGEMIDGQFYLIPYGFDARSSNAGAASAISASEFAKKVKAIAEHGRVLLLLDACHSGAIGAGAWATDPDAKVLQDAMDLENVTVLTSSKKNELSEELPEWRHGALAQAFLDALAGAADSKGIVRLSALTDAMENEVRSLTKGRQHLGMHVNFSGDLFMASHY